MPLGAQTWAEVKENRNGEFLHGEGTGLTFDEADRLALASLANQIWVEVSVSTRQRAQQKTGAGTHYEEITEDDIQTYSETSLPNAHRVTLKHDDDDWVVGRWIRRADLDSVFYARRAKVRDFMQMALRAEETGRADDALRYYSWGQLLLETLPLPSSVTFEADDGQSHVLTAWIPERINAVLRDLRAEVVSRNDMDFELAFTFRGRPVSTLDYRYFNGHEECLESARDGLGPVELYPGYNPPHLDLTYEVFYSNQAHIDREVDAVMRARAKAHAADPHWRSRQSSQMRLAKAKVSLEPSSAASARPAASAASAPSAVSAAGGPDQALCHGRMQRILQSIRSGSYTGADDCFTAEGLDLFARLIAYGRARLMGEPAFSYHAYRGETICRGLLMSFAPPSNLRRSFVEEVVFTFGADGRVNNIAFGLGKVAEDDILGQSAWPEAVRQAILQFLENYKTAFALKRLDYISTLFADDALIITGTVLRRAPQSRIEAGAMQVGGDIIRYNRFTKDKYLAHLERTFGMNEFINIRFSDNAITRSGPNLYQIQIAQDYYSTHYGDHGYLFLLIDMTDPDEPLIKVRTWQPERDPDFGVYNAGDF